MLIFILAVYLSYQCLYLCVCLFQVFCLMLIFMLAVIIFINVHIFIGVFITYCSIYCVAMQQFTDACRMLFDIVCIIIKIFLYMLLSDFNEVNFEWILRLF